MLKFQFRSIKTVLTLSVVLIVAVLTAVLVFVSYNTSSNSVDDAYTNQLINFSRDIDAQISRFFKEQLGNAEFFSKNRTVIKALESGNYDEAVAMFRDFSEEHKIYENIFISTAENNPRVIACSASTGAGTRWGGAGYDDNIKKNLNGEAYISEPRKSPVTGLPVNLFSAPIKKGNTVIGIMALAVNIGEFSDAIIKDIKIAKTGYPYITTLEGLTFGHPKKEYILKLDLRKMEWGSRVLNAKSGDIIRYTFEGINKIIVPMRNEKYRFICGVTVGEKDITDEARSLAILMTILGVIAIIFTGGVIFLVIRSRLAPLGGCRDVMKGMAEGNLSARYSSKYYNDEIGDIVDSLNTAMDNFENTISGIIIASQNVAQAVEQIASGNQNLSQRTSEQASSLEEIASTIEEAAATIRQNTENAVKARDLTNEGAVKSTESNKIAGEAVNSIMEMNESSKKVADIISVINEIAFQTNLLALNAAVEAARAGEQGRGFAVVAGEVRNLAQRSGNAAKEIEDLIKDTLSKVDNGTELVNKTGSVLKEIEASALSTAQLINEIATASMEQQQGIDQINTAVTEMDDMTQQNASLVEETASASEEMSNQAQDLLEMVKQFTINDNIMAGLNGRKQHEVHIRSLSGGGNKPAGTGAVKKKPEQEKTVPDTKEKDPAKLKEIMSKEGFEEF